MSGMLPPGLAAYRRAPVFTEETIFSSPTDAGANHPPRSPIRKIAKIAS
jgi:hypothetical protein